MTVKLNKQLTNKNILLTIIFQLGSLSIEKLVCTAYKNMRYNVNNI